MSTFFALIKALPEIMSFIEWLITTVNALEVQVDVKKNMAQVHASFAAKNSDELKKIFTS